MHEIAIETDNTINSFKLKELGPDYRGEGRIYFGNFV